MFIKGQSGFKGMNHSEEWKMRQSQKMKLNPIKYWLGKKQSQESRIKHSLAMKRIWKDIDQTERKMKISQSKKGKSTWNKGGFLTKEWKRKISESRLGEKHWNFGKTLSDKHRKAISDGLLGDKNPCWRGGITPMNLQIRHSVEYKNWRKLIFKRDNWTCINCKQRGGRLECDHIKPFALYPKDRFDINNGRTLCKKCHKQIGWQGSHINN